MNLNDDDPPSSDEEGDGDAIFDDPIIDVDDNNDPLIAMYDQPAGGGGPYIPLFERYITKKL